MRGWPIGDGLTQFPKLTVFMYRFIQHRAFSSVFVVIRARRRSAQAPICLLDDVTTKTKGFAVFIVSRPLLALWAGWRYKLTTHDAPLFHVFSACLTYPPSSEGTSAFVGRKRARVEHRSAVASNDIFQKVVCQNSKLSCLEYKNFDLQTHEN